MPATIRKATQDDAKRISEIIAEVTGDPHPVAFSEPLSAEQVAPWIDQLGEEGALFVVDDGRQVLAFAAIDVDASRPDECSFGAGCARETAARDTAPHSPRRRWCSLVSAATGASAPACRRTTRRHSRSCHRSVRWCR